MDKFGTERYRPLKDFWLDLTAKDLCASDVAHRGHRKHMKPEAQQILFSTLDLQQF